MRRLKFLVIQFIFLTVVSFAQPSVWDGTSDIWTQGEGTQENPFLIETAQHFAFMAEMVNGGVTTYEGVYFKMTNDIDLNNIEWTPIGISIERCFSGNFDGNNHTIFNLYISSSKPVVGLFGCVVNVIIENLNVIEYITLTTIGSIYANSQRAYSCAGGLVGYSLKSTIRYINTYGTLTIAITSSSSNVHFYIGGIVGCHSGKNGKIQNCVNEATITSPDSYDGTVYTGGIAGYCPLTDGYYPKPVCCCLNKGNIAPSSVGNGNEKISGICNSDVENCGAVCNIKSAYAYGGSMKYSKNSYYVGQIEGTLEAKAFVSQKNSYYIESCGANSGGGIAKTEAAMKSVSFPIVLNADSVVFIQDITPNVNNGYPIIKNTYIFKTLEPSNVASTIATLNGVFYDKGDVAKNVTFEYAEKSSNDYTAVKGNISGFALSCDLHNLKDGTEYKYRFYVENEGERYYSNVDYFTTSALTCSVVKEIDVAICEEDSYDFNGSILSKEGQYIDTLCSSQGCDSVVVLNLSKKPTYTMAKSETICQGKSYDFYGNPITEAGIYKNYVPETDRCLLVTLNVLVNPSFSIDKSEQILAGEKYNFYGDVLTTSGFYTYKTQTQYGCDSIINLTLTVATPYSVTVESANIEYGSTSGSGTYGEGEQVLITAIPKEHYHFEKWSDGNTDNPRTIVVDKDTSLNAVFRVDDYQVTVDVNNSTMGYACCSGKYAYGSTQSFSVNPATGYVFKSWNDGNLDNPRTEVITQETSFIAILEKIKYTISLSSSDETQGQVVGAGLYEPNTSIQIEATPMEHCHFVSWNDGNKENPRNLTVTKSASYVAVFAVDTFSVSLEVNNEDMGFVTGGGNYAYGQKVILVAEAKEHYQFVKWSDGNTDNPRTINITGNTSYLAIFQEIETTYVDDIAKDVFISINNNQILVNGVAPEYVITVLGQKVANQNLQTGIYFVVVDGQNLKVSIP